MWSLGEIVSWVVIAVCVLFVGGLIYAMVEQSVNRQKFGDQLLKSGFKVDYVLDGSVVVAFDEGKRRIAFNFGDGIYQVEYDAVSKWNWVWVERDGRRVKNHIQFYLRDKRRPFIQTEVSERDGQLWHAKLDAIFNC